MASMTDSDVPAEFGLSLSFSFAWLSTNDDMTGGVGGIRGDRSGDARGDGGGWMVVECGPMDPGPPPRVHAEDDDEDDDDDDGPLVVVFDVVIGSGTGVMRRRSTPSRWGGGTNAIVVVVVVVTNLVKPPDSSASNAASGLGVGRPGTEEKWA